MAIDFTFTKTQRELQLQSRKFAREVLAEAAKCETLATPEERFRATKPIYEAMVAAGYLRKCIPAGDANICGDVIYDFNDQIVEPFHEIGDMEPRVTGNHGTTKRQEKAAIKKVLARSRFALPIHDWPAMIEGGQVVARLRDSVPGAIVQSLPRRNWFPA